MFAVVAVALVVASAAGSGSPLPAALFWATAVVWNGFWFLLRIVYELELSADGRLIWKTPLRSGTEHLSDLAQLRPSRFGSNIEVVELADGRRLPVFVRKGFRAFADDLSAVRPDLQVRFGFQGRLAEKMPGWSGYRRRPD